MDGSAQKRFLENVFEQTTRTPLSSPAQYFGTLIFHEKLVFYGALFPLISNFSERCLRPSVSFPTIVLWIDLLRSRPFKNFLSFV